MNGVPFHPPRLHEPHVGPTGGCTQVPVVPDQLPVSALRRVRHNTVAALPVYFHEPHNGVWLVCGVGHPPLTRSDLDRIE